MKKLITLASRFAVGSAVGVGVGYALINSMVYLFDVPVFVATALGYGIGFFCNLGVQIRTGTVKLK